MKIDLAFKYNLGDIVTFKQSLEGDKFVDSRYEICEKRALITEGNSVKITYCFHAYGDKHIGYHDFVDEEKIVPLKTAHPNTETVEFVDVFGKPLEIGDTVTDSLYYKACFYEINLFSLTFVQDVKIESFRYTLEKGRKNGTCEIVTTRIANEHIPHAPHFPETLIISTSKCTKTLPNTVANDIYCAYRTRRENLFKSENETRREFVWLKKHGLYDGLKELFEKWKPASQYKTFNTKNGKASTTSKKASTKASTKGKTKKKAKAALELESIINTMKKEDVIEILKKYTE